jgi:hypothetical protein
MVYGAKKPYPHPLWAGGDLRRRAPPAGAAPGPGGKRPGAVRRDGRRSGAAQPECPHRGAGGGGVPFARLV